MANWKEKLKGTYWWNDVCVNHEQSAITFIETEIIEKLIEDVPDYRNATGVYQREKELLKAKWLGKD